MFDNDKYNAFSNNVVAQLMILFVNNKKVDMVNN